MEVISMTKSDNRVKTLCALAMLTAIAIACDFFLRIPNIGGFLTYEPKDVILVIGAFIFGPVEGIVMALVVCVVEMLTISTTGIIGLVMNFLASAVFIGVSSVIYHRNKKMSRAILGLLAGSVSMIAIMLLWNYIVTPIYMGIPREAVLGLFVPVLIPFNALKAGLNTALALFLYKGVVTALRKTGLVSERESFKNENKLKNSILLIIVSAVIFVTLLLVMLIFAKII
ncbi:MAG: ECF transporter S component [Ruminococcus sp.]|nr:ECF transporter S component [Ruminococcus sp.]